MTTITTRKDTATATQIPALVASGLSLAEVGRKVEMSRLKVRQIAAAHGVTSNVPSDWLAPQMVEFSISVSDRICDYLDEGSVYTAPELRDEFPGVTVKHLRAAVEAADCVGLLGVASPPDKVAFSNESILASIRAADAHKDGPLLTGPIYDALLDLGAIDGPSRVLIIQRFGSWSEACGQAGVEYRRARRTYDGFSDDDLLAWVASYADKQVMANKSITFAGYSRWAKKMAGEKYDAPSGSLIKSRFFGHRSWNEIRDDAIRNAYRDHRDYFARSVTE